MVEMCNEPEDVEGLNTDSVERWRELRLGYTKRTREGNLRWGIQMTDPAPLHLQLPDNYFDDLPGHGILPEMLTAHRHSSSSLGAERAEDARLASH